ncbi:hypothetical protein [Fodinicurvata fenggangensis]|uniref:hypothetical protein n=1 Tax=Fodinicurvata fenggangensis TaxID=1121830 RepID=UPI00047A5EAB|nr:hypothetical protein [Fodinicurvata fenggangensis]
MADGPHDVGWRSHLPTDIRNENNIKIHPKEALLDLHLVTNGNMAPDKPSGNHPCKGLYWYLLNSIVLTAP